MPPPPDAYHGPGPAATSFEALLAGTSDRRRGLLFDDLQALLRLMGSKDYWRARAAIAASETLHEPPLLLDVGHGQVWRIHLLQVLASGVHGKVCLGEVEQPHQLVAVKIISSMGPSGMLTDAQLQELVGMEMGVHARLQQHPHLAWYGSGSGHDADGMPIVFSVMQHVASFGSHSLADVVSRVQLATGRGLPELAARCLMAQLLEGMVHMHDHGVVHRDLKCHNLLL